MIVAILTATSASAQPARTAFNSPGKSRVSNYKMAHVWQLKGACSQVKKKAAPTTFPMSENDYCLDHGTDSLDLVMVAFSALGKLAKPKQEKLPGLMKGTSQEHKMYSVNGIKVAFAIHKCS